MKFAGENDALPTFFALVKETDEASDAVDRFDLVSEDAESTSRFDDLAVQQNDAAERLITFIEGKREELLTALAVPRRVKK